MRHVQNVLTFVCVHLRIVVCCVIGSMCMVVTEVVPAYQEHFTIILWSKCYC